MQCFNNIHRVGSCLFDLFGLAYPGAYSIKDITNCPDLK